MPMFRSGPDQAPPWCEMECFEILTLERGQSHRFERRGRRELLLVAAGACRLAAGDAVVFGRRGALMELPTRAGRFEVLQTTHPTTLVHMAGRWDDTHGGAGLFIVGEGDNRSRPGDPIDYPKTTRFDNHYHDCDEYWIFLDGSGVVYSEDHRYEVKPGDCIATGMGHHHDVAEVHGTVLTGAWLETSHRGRQRRGHLWEHTHGPAQPGPQRV